MQQKFSFIIQARTLSTRLPGKILIPFYNQETILDIQIKNIQKWFVNPSLIIATSTNKADDKIEEKYSNIKGIKIFRGDENNVLKRFVDAATEFEVENIVRVCSDNPFLYMPYLVQLVHSYFKIKSDYISFRFENGTPSIKSHSGLFAEIVSLDALKEVQKLTQDQFYVEHVTNYIYTHQEQFKIVLLPVPEFLEKYVNTLRLTIDTKQDFISLQKLYLAVLNKFGIEYTLEQLLSEINQNNDLLKSMNEQIENHAK
jgi:spore coat polysaccharide biosynthesis protein SpsF